MVTTCTKEVWAYNVSREMNTNQASSIVSKVLGGGGGKSLMSQNKSKLKEGNVIIEYSICMFTKNAGVP